jgi:hypothetical protein
VLRVENDRASLSDKGDIDVDMYLVGFRWNDASGFSIDRQRCDLSLFAKLPNDRIIDDRTARSDRSSVSVRPPRSGSPMVTSMSAAA